MCLNKRELRKIVVDDSAVRRDRVKYLRLGGSDALGLIDALFAEPFDESQYLSLHLSRRKVRTVRDSLRRQRCRQLATRRLLLRSPVARGCARSCRSDFGLLLPWRRIRAKALPSHRRAHRSRGKHRETSRRRLLIRCPTLVMEGYEGTRSLRLLATLESRSGELQRSSMSSGLRRRRCGPTDRAV